MALLIYPPLRHQLRVDLPISGESAFVNAHYCQISVFRLLHLIILLLMSNYFLICSELTFDTCSFASINSSSHRVFPDFPFLGDKIWRCAPTSLQRDFHDHDKP